MLKLLKSLLDPFHRDIRKYLASFSKGFKNGSTILDAGAGEGGYSVFFPESTVVGLDNCIGDSSWNYSGLDVVGDLHKLPFKEGSFDAAVCIVVMEHLHSPWKALQEISSVMKIGGEIFLITPFMWELHQEPHDYFRFSKHGIMHLCKDTGLTLKFIKPLGGFFRVIHYRAYSFLKYMVRKPLLGLLFLPVLPFIILFMILSEPLDRTFELCEHTLGYISILKKE